MPAAAAAATEVAPVAPKSRKKLIIIVAAVVTLLLAIGAGGAVLMMKKKASAEAEATEAADAGTDGRSPAASPPVAKHDPKSVPVFVPLDPFTVNLADRDAERFAQLAVTLEIVDSKTGDQIKNHMPVIRSNILLAIADRTAAELMGREGKVRLAERIKRETARALGYEVGAADEGEAAGAQPAARKRKGDEPDLPVKAVHFSNFIIQ